MRSYLTAGARAVSNTTKRLERRFETATQRAVPGRLWRAWGSSNFPKSGPARNPVGTVFVNGGARTNAAIRYFTTPGRVRAKDGGPVAIPLPAAGARRRDPMMTPERWEAIHGVKLIPIKRRGRAMILAAPGRAAVGGTYRKIGRAKTAADQRRGFMRGEQLVPIFVIMPDLPFANAVALAPMIASSERELAEEFLDAARAVA